MRRIVLVLCVCAMVAVAQADIVTQPYIAGDFNGWSPGVVPMVSLGGGLWEYTISGLSPGQYQQFKITDENTSWGVTAPAANSWYNADASGEVTITFNTNIVSDGWLPEQFRVGVNTDPNTWSLVGDYLSELGGSDWNNADPTQVMEPIGGGIYVKTQTLPAGNWQIKPVNTGSWDGVGTDSRSIDAQNLVLNLASPTEVTIYVDALTGVVANGEDVTVSATWPHYPIPANNVIVSSGSVSALSWTNPDPSNGTDPLAISVKLDKEPAGGYDPNDNDVSTASGTDIESIAVSALTPPKTSPLPDGLYSWQITVTDPNGPVVTKGPLWLFQVGDAPPIPGQPVDQYMWLSQDDSALEAEFGPGTAYNGPVGPNIRYFEVTGTYADDDVNPSAVDANFVNLDWDWANGELGIVEVSDVHTAATKSVRAVYRTIYAEGGNPDNTTVLPGYWQIRLEVTDNNGAVYGTPGIHRIFETCLEAAAADPDDTFASISNDIIIGLGGHYDTNSDCIINLEDFADFAEAWLKKSLTKYEP